jgi:hypothetical protein
MRFCFSLLIAIAACSSGNGGTPKKDGGGTNGGLICPDHPQNCEGTCCGEKCLNTSIDVNNCGGCNTACTGGLVCMGGKCGCLPSGAPCAASQTCCAMGGCADLMNDLRNCGSCGHVCTGQGETCVNGMCSCGGQTCNAGDVCCNGTCKSTCTVTPPDMAMSMTMGPFCDCSGLNPSCIVSKQCVGNNCCLEDQIACATIGCPAGTCIDMTPCTPSTTP